jgi:hypothetical protein
MPAPSATKIATTAGGSPGANGDATSVAATVPAAAAARRGALAQHVAAAAVAADLAVARPLVAEPGLVETELAQKPVVAAFPAVHPLARSTAT